VTPTITITPTISITPTITPTISITPTITPTTTITPTVTPDYSYITLQPLTGLGQDVYLDGITDESQFLPAYNFRDMNGLYRAINYNLRSDNGVFTILKKYQNNDYTSTLIGSSALDSPFNWIHEITNQINPIYPFISPTDLGNTALIPFSGYVSNDVSTPYNVISGVKVYPDYKFNTIFARTTAVSAVIVRGLTGTAFNDNLMFVEFATGLRGFDYATLYGNNVAFANIEFRVPLIRALSSGPITSNFFRNLQFTAFYDIGSSWTGPVPLTSNNSVRDRLVVQDSFVISLKEYQNPWLYSYGAGLRTMIFGYYLKFDVAWPTENYKLKDPRTYVTLGFDF
jgi:hypothetical protein